jgi:hypothetical protein
MQTIRPEAGSSSGITDPDNTYMMIANDAFKLRWVPLSDSEQVDLT